MLQLAQARALFADLETAPAPRRPVLQTIAMQHLASAEALCPGLSDVELLRFRHTLNRRGDESLMLRHPSAAEVYRAATRQNSEPNRANTFAAEARLLDPLGDW
jgi:hypothetical protein